MNDKKICDQGFGFWIGPIYDDPQNPKHVINSSVHICDPSHGSGTMNAIHQTIEEFEYIPLNADVWSQYNWNKSNLQIEIIVVKSQTYTSCN